MLCVYVRAERGRDVSRIYLPQKARQSLMLQRERLEVWSHVLPDPPPTLRVIKRREVILIQRRADEFWWRISEGTHVRHVSALREETERERVILQQFGDKNQQPGVVLRARHGGKPYLPIETRLVWCDHTRSATEGTGLALELVRET